MAVPLRHGRIHKSAIDELNLASLSTRVDFKDKLSLLDPSSEAFSSLIPIEHFRLAVHKVLVGA